MANYRKSFNFRNGVQVDTDNFIVNANGLVGIGTSIPTEAIDAIGNAKISGLTTTGTLGVAETANFYNDLKVGSSIEMDPVSGFVTATRFVGSAEGLTGIFAISTTGLVAQGVGLHTFRSIGIGTTNPEYYLQVGENPTSSVGVGITNGGIHASGVITATTFSGDLTGDVTGDLTGVASTATELENSRNFSITGDLEASAISFNGTADVAFDSALSASFSANTSGIITASKFEGSIGSASTAGITTATITDATITNANITNADVGIGTFDDLRIDKSTEASLVITSTTNSSVSIGESVGAGNSSAQFLYTPGTGRLDINNYDIGGVNINLHEGTGTGTTLGFSVKYDNTKLFDVNYDGKVGVNRGSLTLEETFEVGGSARVTENMRVAGVLTVNQGGPFEVTFGDGSAIPIPDTQNFNTISGISTFKNLNVSDEFTVGQGVTMFSDAFIGIKAGIGTTNADNFVSGISDLTLQTFGTIYSDSGVFSAGRLAITKKSDGSLHTDDRIIPSSPIDYGSLVPFVEYGDFQVEVGAASLITENVLMVPSVGAATVGFGTTNGGLIPTSFLPDGNRYLTKVGINTYYARSIFDVGTASTTMNSYFIPPSLTQSEIDIMQDLWDTPTRTGYAGANKVTPDGLVPGGIVYNKTTDQIQVRDTASSFRTLGSPQVASGEVTGEVSHSTSETTTGLSASITLKSSSSKVMVHVTQPVHSVENIGRIVLKRTIGAVTETLVTTNYGAWEVNTTNIISSTTASISYLDTPGNTGPVTYETFGERVSGANNFYSNAAYEGSSRVNRTSHITLMEIE